MSKKEAGILQIRKYLNGELDGKAMHQLERRAQHDPFLMDALDGFENSAKDQQFNLNEINNRLQQRIAPKEHRIIPWGFLSIAASVLVFLTVGGIWLYNNKQGVKHPPVAQIVKPETETPPVAAGPAAPIKKNEVVVVKPAPKLYERSRKRTVKLDTVAALANSDVTVDRPGSITAEKDTTPLNEQVVMGYEAQRNNAKSKDGYSVNNNQAPQNIVKGTIVDKNGKLPIPGVSVSLAGTNRVAVTGLDGNFTLLVDSNRGKLVVSTMGFDTRVVNLYNFGSMGTIALNPHADEPAGFLSDKSVAKTGKDISNGDVDTKKMAPNNAGKVASGQAARIVTYSNSAPTTAKRYVTRNFKRKRLITGKVIDKDDGSPIPGVIVKIPGTTTGTQTDAAGRFTLRADSSQKNLSFVFSGSQTQNVSISNFDADTTIALDPAIRQLNEVAATPYSAKTEEVIYAHPADGLSSFNKYLKENAISPDGKKGVVRLSFDVEPDGTIIGIRVVKSVSPATDKKAIQLINNGPEWIGNSTGQTEKVRVRVRFGK